MSVRNPGDNPHSAELPAVRTQIDEATRLLSEAEGNLRAWGESGLCALSFRKSRKADHPQALALAMQAERFAQLDLPGATVYLAGFGSTPAQASLASNIIWLLKSGVTVYAGGKVLQEWSSARRVLECFTVAAACHDTRAHCVVAAGQAQSVREPVPSVFWDQPRIPDRKLVRCRHMVERGFRFQVNHPSSEEDQLQAGAVAIGTDWCPFFKTTAGSAENAVGQVPRVRITGQ